MSRPSKRLAMATAPALVLGCLVAVTAAPAQAVSPNVVIAEAYGGGGNNGAFYRSDFVELFNRSDTAVDLTNWKIQYYSAGGSDATTTTIASGTIAAGGRFLVKQADGANTTTSTPLPTPDATGTTAMSGTNAKVKLVDPSATVVDMVGWGSANEFEGAPAGATTNTTSVARADACKDTDNNAVDFSVGSPTPQNSSTETVVCDDGPPPVDDPETIPQIQGSAHLSPLDGKPVNKVEGIVTALSGTGFWMQSATPDADANTSEGIFVYTRTAPTVATGDLVSVDGAVSEFRPGGSGGNDNLTTTEIVGPTVTVASSGNPLPAPVVIGVDRIAPQQVIEAEQVGSVEYSDAAFRPDRDAIDFYESMEGMLVGVKDAQVVGPTASFGEIPVVPGANVTATRTVFNGVLYGGYDQPNAMRIQLDDALIGGGNMPKASVGDTIPGLVSGPLDYSFSNFKLEVTSAPTIASGNAKREFTDKAKPNELTVASFNVENLAPQNDATKFERLANQIVTKLRKPDIIAVEEVQDNSGATSDGTVDSSTTSGMLIAAIKAAGGPTYDARWINPEDGMDGGQPGGNIRNVLLFRTDRVKFVDRPGGDATTAVSVEGTTKHPRLSVSPGRIDPTNAAWEDSRKPVVGEFLFRGRSVFVAAVHFNSKGGDDPLFGRWQQPVRSSEEQRHAQAHVVRDFANALLTKDPQAKFVIAGDVNDFEFSETSDILVDILEGTGTKSMTDLPRTLPVNERWSYVYEGNSQTLDHLLVSPSLVTTRTGGVTKPWRAPAGKPAFRYDIVHTNSPFYDQDSDHDPQVAKFLMS